MKRITRVQSSSLNWPKKIVEERLTLASWRKIVVMDTIAYIMSVEIGSQKQEQLKTARRLETVRLTVSVAMATSA